MFDLEFHVQQWRQEMAGRVGADAAVLDELENHLREAYQRRAAAEPPEQAWQAALQELGTPAQLAREFRKLRPTSSLLRWPARIAIGLAPILVVAIYVALIGTTAEKSGGLLAAHVLAVMVGYGTGYLIAGLVTFAVLVRLLRGLTDVDHAELRRAFLWLGSAGFTATSIGFVLGGAWAFREWGAFWNGDPFEIGAVGVIGWYGALVVWASRRPDSERGVLLLASIGHLVVTCAWFVAAAIGRDRLHSYGSPEAAIGMFGLTLEAVLAALILLPAACIRKLSPTPQA